MTSLNVPDDREYTHSHEWIRIDGESALVGITVRHVEIAGEILRVKLPDVSSAAKTGDVVARICSRDSEREVRAPISGTVVEVNRDLATNPRLLVDQPYAAGWLFRLKIEAGEELEHLLNANVYREHLRAEETLDVESP
jgi:glycine cleavage system H protein